MLSFLGAHCVAMHVKQAAYVNFKILDKKKKKKKKKKRCVMKRFVQYVA
jgi:hypothetical protein